MASDDKVRKAQFGTVNYMNGHRKEWWDSPFHSLRRKCDDPHANFQRIRKIKTKK